MRDPTLSTGFGSSRSDFDSSRRRSGRLSRRCGSSRSDFGSSRRCFGGLERFLPRRPPVEAASATPLGPAAGSSRPGRAAAGSRQSRQRYRNGHAPLLSSPQAQPSTTPGGGILPDLHSTSYERPSPLGGRVVGDGGRTGGG